MFRALPCLILIALLSCARAGDTSRPDGRTTEKPTPAPQSSVPVTQSSVPVTQSSVPVTQSSVPVTQSSVPVTQSSVPVTQSSGPVTQTPAGLIRGSWMETRGGRRFQAYRGVRYAEPPVGKLRFMPPVAITSYPEEVDAREEGPACPQPSHTPGFLVDEDCLRLNVYTPENANSSSLLPVIVYIHPGGFYSVTGRSDVAGPKYLLERDIVLVTINYRLGSLGFLSTGDKWSPGNNGFKDQVVALRWVQRNIRAFGGNPDSVTAAGYSAGAFSIGLHMVSPMAKGLFHRAIMMSASPLSQVVYGSDQLYLTVKQAWLLGCYTQATQRHVGCLRVTASWQDFANSLDKMFEFGYDPILLWTAVVEPDCGQERYLVEPPMTSFEQGRHHTVPTLIGQTTDEFFWKAFNVLNNETQFANMSSNWSKIAPISFMLPAKGAGAGETADVAARELKKQYFHDQPLKNDSNTAESLGKLYSDAIIGFAVHRMTRVLARYSPHPVHQYEFAYVGERSHYVDPITKKPVGVAHHDDLLYLLSVPAAFPDVAVGSADDQMVSTLTSVWYNFAAKGDPRPGPNVSWPAFTPSRRQYLRIGTELELRSNLFEDRYDVWNKLYPVDY